MINIRSIIALSVCALCFSAGWTTAKWHSVSVQTRNEAAEAARQAENRRLVAEIAKVTQEAISQVRIENRTIYQKTRREVIRDPIYIDCVVPAGGSGLLNQARGADSDRSGADDTMPADADDPDPAGRDD